MTSRSNLSLQAKMLCFLLATFAAVSCSRKDDSVKSPDGKISVSVLVTNDEKATYTVLRDDSVVIDPSKLGVIMEDHDFSTGLTLEAVSPVESVKDSYEMKHGKRKSYSYEGNRRVYHFVTTSGLKMDVIFQVSNDGVAFQYYFPERSDSVKKIKEEVSSFRFPAGTKAWLQPLAEAKTGWSRSNPSYEEYFLQDIAAGTPSPTAAGWAFPALFKTNSTWVLLTETGLSRDYCGTRLRQQSPEGEYSIGFPQAAEVSDGGELNPQSTLPWYSPWRVIALGNLATIVESSLGTDLAPPAIDGNFAWVKPGRAAWSWVLYKDDSTVYPVQKRFVDYAADMGWEYCLVDADWDRKIGYEKIKELAAYAKTKNVNLLLWYNSAGDWNDTPYTPKSKLLTHEDRVKEFQLLKDIGIAGAKIDFFGGDGQSVIMYYHDILKDAADVGLAVNFHGCTLPRGWARTYPNLLSMESIRGMEFVTFEQGGADAQPNHCTMIPFTRNAFDPMDFTPTAFSELPGLQRKTSNAFELALPVLYLTGVEHFAEVPEGMAKVPDYVKQLMKDYPVSWDEVKFIDGYPGKYAIIARRVGNKWYVGGINGEATERKVTLKLPVAGKGVLVTDGETNRSFAKTEIATGEGGDLDVVLKPFGGFVLTMGE